MTDFIQGDKFKQIADFLYAPEVKSADAYDNLQNTLIVSQLKDYDIIYTHTFYVKQLYETIRNIDKKLIIITHNSDINIDDSYVIPYNVIKWHAQNVNVIDPIIESIPIGLENDRWYPEIQKKEKMIRKLKEPRDYRNLLYMNHNIENNREKRLPPYFQLKDMPFVTTNMGVNGRGFDDYLDNIYNHRFVICPQGNGMDTHRVWECLYMGTIPVVLKDLNNRFYNDLPICFVDEWNEVTEEFLSELYVPIKKIKDITKKLTFEYWKNKITTR